MPHVRVGDVNLYYESKGNGPCVVLVAGLSHNGTVWDDVLLKPDLSLTLVTVDNRGAGLSDAPRGPYSIEMLSKDIHGLCTSLGIEQAVLVGHSMGGFVALQLSLDEPAFVGGLVLVSTAATGLQDQLGMTEAAAAALSRTNGPFEEIVRQNMAVGLGQGIHVKNPAAIERFIKKRLERPPRGIGFVAQQEAARAFDVRNRLKEISCPCCVVHGVEDQVVSLERARELAGTIGGATLVELKDVGHFPQIEAVDDLVGAIRSVGKY